MSAITCSRWPRGSKSIGSDWEGKGVRRNKQWASGSGADDVEAGSDHIHRGEKQQQRISNVTPTMHHQADRRMPRFPIEIAHQYWVAGWVAGWIVG